MLALPNRFKALVVGSNGALGSAFVRQLKLMPACAEVVAASRNGQPSVNILDAESVRKFGEEMRLLGPFHVIVDATGALTLFGKGPEKSLSMLEAKHLSDAFGINAIGPALLLAALSPALARGDSVYAKLSARVGSISDNRTGGWYGYRASKAALNMVLQTAAIELQRRNANLRVVALQPGTVRSALTEKFVANHTSLLDPDESVAGMLRAIWSLPSRSGASFIDYQGGSIAW
jgi:NAD(P)-dependent dehydrogenase (short-subunit alcohol dehydrogenase family)